MNVLLVEDDLVLADGLSRMLKSHGLSVNTVNNGTDADALLQRYTATVLVLDIGLPAWMVLKWCAGCAPAAATCRCCC